MAIMWWDNVLNIGSIIIYDVCKEIKKYGNEWGISIDYLANCKVWIYNYDENTEHCNERWCDVWLLLFKINTPIWPTSEKKSNCFINKYKYWCVLYLFTCFANHEPKLMFIVAMLRCIFYMMVYCFTMLHWFFLLYFWYKKTMKKIIWIIIQV